MDVLVGFKLEWRGRIGMVGDEEVLTTRPVLPTVATDVMMID